MRNISTVAAAALTLAACGDDGGENLYKEQQLGDAIVSSDAAADGAIDDAVSDARDALDGAFADAMDMVEGDGVSGQDGVEADGTIGTDGISGDAAVDGTVTDTDQDTTVGEDGGADSVDAEDAGADAGTDVAVDTGVDTGEDAGTDTGQDTGVDTGEDIAEDTGTDTGNNGVVCTPPAVRVSFQVDNGLFPGANAQKPMDVISVEEIQVLMDGKKESNGTPENYSLGNRVDACLENNKFVLEITTFCEDTNAKCAAAITVFDGTTLMGYHPLTPMPNAVPDIQTTAPATGQKKVEVVELPGKTSLFQLSQ